MKNARGFTIAELAAALSIAGIVAAGAGAFYFEGRASAARTEANIALVREASLAVETIARDLKNARRASSNASGLELDVGDPDRVRFVIDAAGLSRDDGEERIAIARFVRAVSVREEKGGFHLELALERSLAEKRTVRIVREAFVGTRRR
jgi:prepilin-type N-terminal cleavage/methylation domain-containing protein